jgi:hypothetical protein
MPDVNPPGKHETLHAYDGEYTIDVPAGPHTLTIDNTGTDWIAVSYLVERAEVKREPDLRLYGMRGRTTALIWVHNARHNYTCKAPGRLPEPAAPTMMTIPDWPRGKYRVQFWDTYGGTETTNRDVTVGRKGLRLELPAVQKDVALKIHAVE